MDIYEEISKLKKTVKLINNCMLKNHQEIMELKNLWNGVVSFRGIDKAMKDKLDEARWKHKEIE